MNCPNCNEEIKEGSKFCEHCGAAITSEPQTNQAPQGQPQFNQAAQGQPQFNQSTQGQPQFNQAAQGQPQFNQSTQGQSQFQQAPPKKDNAFTKALEKFNALPGKTKGIMCGAIGGAILVMIIVIALVATHKSKIDLQEYTEVNFEGYNEYGTASIEFKSSKLNKLLMEKAGLDDYDDIDSFADLMSEGKSAIKDYNEYEAARSSISYTLNKEENLKNGDVVKVKFEFDNEKAADIGVKFVGDTMSFKVKGLKKVKKVNPFDNVEVKFNGTAPYASVEVDKKETSDYMSDVYFSTDKSDDLNVGDKVVVSVNNYDEDFFMKQYGCVITETEKEYECKDVDTYIQSVSDVSDDLLSQMKSQTEDSIKAYFSGEKDSIKMGELKYVGYYFLKEKSEVYWGGHNKAIIVYSVVVKSKEKKFKPTTVYMPLKFQDLIKYKDGTCYVDLNSTDIEGDTDLEFSWWNHVSGYTKELDMKNELVDAELASYTFEKVGNLK